MSVKSRRYSGALRYHDAPTISATAPTNAPISETSCAVESLL